MAKNVTFHEIGYNAISYCSLDSRILSMNLPVVKNVNFGCRNGFSEPVIFTGIAEKSICICSF